MLRVLGVHGAGSHRYRSRSGTADQTRATLTTQWLGHLRTAVDGRTPLDLRVAYYGDHLEDGNRESACEDDPSFLTPGERELLARWVTQLWPELAAAPDGERAEQALGWLTRAFGPGTRLFGLHFCRELHTYLTAADRSAAARQAVAAEIAEHRPDVIVAHSLGALVTYQALWEDPGHETGLLVTLGGPLALPGALGEDEPHGRPPSVRRWVNVADIGDIVAVPQAVLAERFTGLARDLTINAGIWEFQTPGAYLRSPAVARVILEA
ncbi:hypothetical protein ORV05_06095 [Amycolatopsis cynarae]|uniref:Serine peptidase n=1 Tax=Amycolatopsis cynarae TaxID=2995223 RepID=A0ABY7B5A1_9PSEU|nr:hypothetical protein [Amycolatopsis sp. HUAS 11-8]WAL67356.1 hypothetical protein ORV05_06095 [Amycolatopsis sp. HUAS 11-8]